MKRMVFLFAFMLFRAFEGANKSDGACASRWDAV
jgi:hypothetical protein